MNSAVKIACYTVGNALILFLGAGFLMKMAGSRWNVFLEVFALWFGISFALSLAWIGVAIYWRFNGNILIIVPFSILAIAIIAMQAEANPNFIFIFLFFTFNFTYTLLVLRQVNLVSLRRQSNDDLLDSED